LPTEAQSPLMRLPEVEKIVCLSKGAIYRAMSNGEFPKPIKITHRAVAWRRAEIMEWIESREKS
jgi:prophage regulatory protein